MSESEITDVYNKMLEDLVRLCRILLNYQMIHGVDAEDIVQRVVLRALEKKEQMANHKNLYGWFVNACKLECITLARRSRIERRRLGISLPLEPEILIEKQQDELIQWLRKSEMNELLEELREQGYSKIEDVKYAVLENSGQLSVFPWTAQQPPTAQQMGLELQDDVTLPTVLINDGRLLRQNLTACGRDEQWLKKQLSRKKVASPREVFLMTLDEDGTVFCVKKEQAP